MWRNRAHCVDLKKGCPLTSEAPAREPNRRFSSFTNNFLIKDLQLLSSGSSLVPGHEFVTIQSRLTWLLKVNRGAPGSRHHPEGCSQKYHSCSCP